MTSIKKILQWHRNQNINERFEVLDFDEVKFILFFSFMDGFAMVS